MFAIIAAIAELERDLIRERVVAGVQRAKASGKHCGRPVLEIDVRPALGMLRAGYGLKATARACKLKRSTLRRKLVDVGQWPVQPATHD